MIDRGGGANSPLIHTSNTSLYFHSFIYYISYIIYSTFLIIKQYACMILFCFQKRRVQVIFIRIINFERFWNDSNGIFIFNYLHCHKVLQKINVKIYTEHVCTIVI